MELEILESSKNKVRFKLKGETHTFCNALRKELWEDKSVVAAGYKIEHTLESEPIFILETESKTPKKSLSEASERLGKQFKEFSKLAKSLK